MCGYSDWLMVVKLKSLLNSVIRLCLSSLVLIARHRCLDRGGGDDAGAAY